MNESILDRHSHHSLLVKFRFLDGVRKSKGARGRVMYPLGNPTRVKMLVSAKPVMVAHSIKKLSGLYTLIHVWCIDHRSYQEAKAKLYTFTTCPIIVYVLPL